MVLDFVRFLLPILTSNGERVEVIIVRHNYYIQAMRSDPTNPHSSFFRQLPTPHS